ncbi:MAG: glycosyltransferase family 39 protein [Chloroflexi bacterium]|nr:glycosyltransferase family 39 protein [Chloroflexota bacterium]
MSAGDAWRATLAATPAVVHPGRAHGGALALIRDRRVATVLSIVAIVAIGAFAKLPEAILPIGSDTGMFATYARTMLEGGRPYVAFYDIHPPLTHYYWTLVELLAGTDWSRTCIGTWGTLVPQPCISLLAHIFDLALTCVTAGLVYAIARRLELRPLVGVFASLLVVWFANESMISMEGSTPTKLTLVPCTLAVYAYLRALPEGRLGWAILAGAAAMLGALTKQPALVTLVALVAYVLPGLLRGEPAARRVLFGLALGGVCVLAPVVVYMGAIGSLGGFVDQPWGYNVERFVLGYWQTPAGLTSPATRIDRVVGDAGGLLFVGAVLGGLALGFGPARGHQRLLLVWGLFSLVAIAGFREFAQVVAVLALLAALGVGRLWDAAGRDGLGLGRPLAGRIALLTIFGAIFVLTSSFQLTELRRAMYERGPSGAPADPEVVATYLRSTAPPGPIFVWGNAAQIYALSGREPASRFVIAEFTNTSSPWVTQSREEVMDDLHQKPPAVIVVDPRAAEPGLQLSDYPALQQLIASCYARVAARLPANWGVYTRASDGC